MEGNQKENTLGEWSDSEGDEIIRNIDENTLGIWSDSEDDEIIRNVDEKALGIWSDSEDDEIIRNVDENTLREQRDDNEDENVQTGHGRKRKSDEVAEGPSRGGEKFYVIERVKEVKSKKFRMSGTDYAVHFNNALSDLDLVESLERTQEIFEHLLNDVTAGMNEKIRYVSYCVPINWTLLFHYLSCPSGNLHPNVFFPKLNALFSLTRTSV